MGSTDEMLENNEQYAASFDKGDLPAPPSKGVAVVACMDARLNVSKILGLDEWGDRRDRLERLRHGANPRTVQAALRDGQQQRIPSIRSIATSLTEPRRLGPG